MTEISGFLFKTKHPSASTISNVLRFRGRLVVLYAPPQNELMCYGSRGTIFTPMPSQSEVKQIVDLKDPTTTLLRQYSKETLIASIIEIKRSQTSEAIRLKELEIQYMQINKETEKEKLLNTLSQKLLEFGENMKDHKYGPKAIGDISMCLTSIMGTPPVKGTSGSEGEIGEDDIENRITVAREQGMRWNNADKRPGKLYTVRKKVEEWEFGYEKGMNEDLTVCITGSVGEIFASGEAYATGLCKQMEDKLGIGPSSKYLKTRFKRNLDRMAKGSMVTLAPEPATPRMSVDDHVDEMYKRVWGDSLEGDAKKNDRIRVIGNLRREFTRCDGDLTSFRRDIIKNSSYHTSLPVFIVYEEKEHDSDNSRSRDVIDNKYNDQIEKFLEEYVNEFEGK
jgi:hypothetical protein